jgi:hypothetical protein
VADTKSATSGPQVSRGRAVKRPAARTGRVVRVALRRDPEYLRAAAFGRIAGYSFAVAVVPGVRARGIQRCGSLGSVVTLSLTTLCPAGGVAKVGHTRFVVTGQGRKWPASWSPARLECRQHAMLTKETALTQPGSALAVSGFHHFSPTVSDVEASAEWYARVFGMNRVPVSLPQYGAQEGGYAVLLLDPRSGIVISAAGRAGSTSLASRIRALSTPTRRLATP